MPNPMVTQQQTRNLKPCNILDLVDHVPPSTKLKSYTTTLAEPHWSEAMHEEFWALISQDTWTLVHF